MTAVKSFFYDIFTRSLASLKMKAIFCSSLRMPEMVSSTLKSWPYLI